MYFQNDIPISPFFVFIKGLCDKSDEDILKFLGLGNYQKINAEEIENVNCISMSRDNNWIHIMDSFGYELWLSDEFSDRIVELGKMYQVFTCSVGDVDRSFDFRYFKDGSVVREYVVESPNYNDQIVKIDFGVPFSGEAEALGIDDEFEKMIALTRTINIELPKSLHDVRHYKS